MPSTDGIGSRLRGTLQSLFRILDVQWSREAADAIGARDAVDGAYITVRGLDPATDDDLVTLRYFNANSAPGAVAAAQFALALATADSTTALAANATPLRAKVQIVTAYSPGATISIGKAGGGVDLLMVVGDINPQVQGIYEVSLVGVSWGAGAAVVRATVAGGPAVGAAIVIVEYATVINP